MVRKIFGPASKSNSLVVLSLIGMGLLFSLEGCATLKVTPELKANVTGKAISAKLGVQLGENESLKKVFLQPDKSKIGIGQGEYFSQVMLLPLETRYIAPQDIYDQFGVDLVLQLQMTDTKTSGGVNPIFFWAIPMGPLGYFIPYARIMTYQVVTTIEANLRDAHTGRLLWAKTESSAGTDHFSPILPEKRMAQLLERCLHNGVVKIFEAMSEQLKDYRPGAAMEKIARAGSSSSQLSTQQGNRYAVVIGIENYREQLPKADFAASDAREMAKFLVKHAGYKEENVVLRINEQATRSDMEKYFEGWLKNNLDANSSLLVYFSGHGAPQPTTGDAYLVPYDGDPVYIEQTGYPLKRLYETLDQLPAKDVVVMLDSCFSGAGGRSVIAKGAKPLVTVQNTSLNSGKVVALTATAGNHISMAYQEKAHGLFTYYALQGLAGDADSNGDGSIDVRELFYYLKPQVQRVARTVYNTEQTPQLREPTGLLDATPVKLK